MGKPRCARIVAMPIGSRMAAMTVKRPPHWGHLNIRLSSQAQLIGVGAARGGASAWSAEWVLALTGASS